MSRPEWRWSARHRKIAVWDWLAFVVASFVIGVNVGLRTMGIGLAAAILIDATIVRGVLLPATMKLLGRWNWYLPRWLEWLAASSTSGRQTRPRRSRPPRRRRFEAPRSRLRGRALSLSIGRA